MAWDKNNPSDDELLINAPAQIRANWAALEAMTDASLLITNAKCSPTMGLVDTKLAQITTAGKVSGTALTGLASIPVGAGVIPAANLTSVAQKGANSDITSLSGLTTPLSVAQGGNGNATGNNEIDFKAGDWIMSSVTTPRTGWTNVSATYSNKFIRINATPLTTGGADTHSHTNGTLTCDSHVLTIAEMPSHYHASTFNSHGTGNVGSNGNGQFGNTDSMGGGGGHSHTISGSSASASNVPAYVQGVMFQKN